MHVESMCSPFIVQDQALFSRLDFSIFANLIANSPYTQQCLQELTTFSDKNIMTTIDLLSQIHSRPAQNEAILNVCTALLLKCPKMGQCALAVLATAAYALDNGVGFLGNIFGATMEDEQARESYGHINILS